MTSPTDVDASPPTLVADVLAPVAVDTAYSYRVPADLALKPGDFVVAPLGTRQTTGVVWALREGGRRQSQDDHRKARLGADESAVARLHRLGGALDARAARHGAADGDARRRSRRAAGAEDRLPRDGKGACARDAGPRARARRARRRRRADGQDRAWRSRRLLAGRRRRPRRGRRARAGRADFPARRAAARRRLPPGQLSADQRGRGATPSPSSSTSAPIPRPCSKASPAREDGSLFRGDRRRASRKGARRWCCCPRSR